MVAHGRTGARARDVRSSGAVKRVINVEPIADPIPRRAGDLDARSIAGLRREPPEPAEPSESVEPAEPARSAAEEVDS